MCQKYGVAQSRKMSHDHLFKLLYEWNCFIVRTYLALTIHTNDFKRCFFAILKKLEEQAVRNA
ncbi:hypothetical protein SAMN05216375_1321 [Trichococcus ilyis]|uniref:Uncharacterized protein n=1 Tax=Trichococcus ilyis TaxID=640938 RepID=A0A143Z260_9LACT|nr:Hypothetical protein TR210_1987 [Trichococcus ilyis]SEJ85665.1 hypothetical protein SAMN05216375_1321 [Trichococcus ilyis]